MASVMAIVSKAIFDKEARGLAPGQIWPTQRYASSHKALSPLADGGDLFLVTVRPPDEQLWLVAVLRAPKLVKGEWRASTNAEPIRDITTLRSSIKFASGVGLTAKPGALGMSLQTPRALTDDDVTRLGSAPRGAAQANAHATTPAAAAKRARTNDARTPTKPGDTELGAAQPAMPGELADLAAALAHLQAGRAGPALDAVLAAWRSLRAPALGDLVALVGKHVDRGLPAVGERGGPDDDDRRPDDPWLDVAAAGRAADVGRLLAALDDCRVVDLKARYALLVGFAPDPRLAEPALAIPIKYSYEAGPALTRAFEIAERSGDPRARAVLDDMLGGSLVAKKSDSSGWRAYLEKHARRAQKARDALPASVAIPAAVKAQIAACTDACKRLLAGPAPTEAELTAVAKPAVGHGSLDDLLDAVLRTPDDDAPRVVYGDALSEAGDPRGEFIALQLERSRAGMLSAAAEKREKALLAEHGRSWLGPLAAVIRADSVRFARGFLDACAVEIKTAKQRALIGHPLWATVRQLDAYDPELVTHPCMRALRRAPIAPRQLAELAARPAPVPLEAVIGHLEMAYGLRARRGIDVGTAADWGAALDVGALTSLTSLELCSEWDGDNDRWIGEVDTPADLAWLLESRLGKQLTELDLFSRRDEIAIAPWIAWLADTRRDVRVRIRFTNANTSSGTSEILAVFDLVPHDGVIDVTLSLNNQLSESFMIVGQIADALAGLPSNHAPALAVRYIGSKKRTRKGFPELINHHRRGNILAAAFATVSMD
jgi:uncharacterized protein (TIGR02996 family)